MGTFIKAIRKGLIASPLRADFDLREWAKAGTPGKGVDQADLKLILSGYIFDQKLRLLWSRFSRLELDSFNGETLRQAFVAVCNRDLATLRGKMHQKMDEHPRTEPAYMEEFQSMKVDGALGGGVHSVDDLAASGVDGLHMPLRKTYEMHGSSSRKLDLKRLGEAVILGQLQSFIASVWEDCVWCDWEIGMHDKNVIALPSNKQRAQARSIGNARTASLASQLTHFAFYQWSQMSEEERSFVNASRRNVAVDGSGNRIKLRIEAAGADPTFPLQSFVLRVIATEIYFRDLFDSPLANVGGVTIGLVFSAWEVLYSLGNALISRMPHESGINEVKDIWQFAPRIPRSKLYRLVGDALKLDSNIARRIVDFLTFNHNQTEELWARPFVQLNETMVTPVLACLIQPNPLRMVEKWMKLGGLDLQARGKAFEDQARNQLTRALGGSRMLEGGGVCPHRYQFKNTSDNPGDVDLLIWFGSTILVGEVKCTLFPARPSEFHNYFGTLGKAGEQIKRKAKALGSQTDRFWSEIARRAPPPETHIVSFVLTNLCLGVGLDSSGVSITDIHVLERFLAEGGIEQFVLFDPMKKNFTVGQKLEFYQTAEEAEQLLEKYLADPPQLRPFRAGLKQVSNVIPTLGEEDVPWVVVDYDIELDREKLNQFRLPGKSDAPSLEGKLEQSGEAETGQP